MKVHINAVEYNPESDDIRSAIFAAMKNQNNIGSLKYLNDLVSNTDISLKEIKSGIIERAKVKIYFSSSDLTVKEIHYESYIVKPSKDIIVTLDYLLKSNLLSLIITYISNLEFTKNLEDVDEPIKKALKDLADLGFVIC